MPENSNFFLNKFKTRAFLTASLLIILAILLFSLLSFQSPLSQKTKEIAKINNISLKKSDLELEAKIGLGYSGQEKDLLSSFLDLSSKIVREEILKSLSLSITPKEIEEEAKALDQRTSLPQELNKIKTALGQNYLEFYVKPLLVSRKLEEYFEKNKNELSSHKKDLAQALRQKIKQGSKMQDLQNPPEVFYNIFSLASKPQEENFPFLPQDPNQPFSIYDPELLKIASELKSDELYSEIQDLPTSFRIIKLKEKKEDTFLLEVLEIPKLDFNQWLEKEAQNKVKIKVFDKALEQQIRQQAKGSLVEKLMILN